MPKVESWSRVRCQVTGNGKWITVCNMQHATRWWWCHMPKARSKKAKKPKAFSSRPSSWSQGPEFLLLDSNLGKAVRSPDNYLSHPCIPYPTMRPFEIFPLKRSRTAHRTAKQKTTFEDLPEVADIFWVSSSSSSEGSEQSNCSTPKRFLESQSSTLTRDIQTKLRESMQIRMQQRKARHQRMEGTFVRTCSEPMLNVSPMDSPQSFSCVSSPELNVKRKLAAVREQQVKNLLATERLFLKLADVSEQ